MKQRLLSTDDTRKIHEAALRILEELGMDVRDKETRADLFNAGCIEADTGYILFPSKIVESALASIPKSFILYDRNGDPKVDVYDTVPHFGPGLNAINILDHRTSEQRECVLQDVHEAAKVCDQLSNIDMASGLGNPCDLEPDEQCMGTIKAIMSETVKPFPFIAHNEVEDVQVWEYIAEVAGGWDSLAEKPFALGLTGPYSPLELGEEACRKLRFTARKHLPVVNYPAMIPGTTGPVTMAGAIAQSAAETLAGYVVHQLAEPGAPVITASSILPMDLRTGVVAYGSPEYHLAGLGQIDYYNDLGVPTWIGAGCSDSHRFDTQAAYEAGASMYTASLANTAFIHNLGFVSGGKSGSLELLVLADEIAGGVKQFMKGITVNDETLGVDVTQRNYINHEFMMDDHTLANMRTAIWDSKMLKRTPLEKWELAGAKSLEKRVREKLDDLLNTPKK